MRRWDWWIELGLVPFAMLTIGGMLWSEAFADAPRQYGTAAGALGVVWFIVFLVVDLVRFRHRAAVLLTVPVALPLVVAGFAFADLAMASRGVIEECPVGSSTTYEVRPTRGSSYWETSYLLECEHDEVEVEFRADGPPVTTDEFEFEVDDTGDSCCGGDFDWDDEQDTIEVQYDPVGVIGPRTDDFDQDPTGALYGAGLLALLCIGIRIAAARARAHGP
jgi:hypothetical protein